MADQKLNIEITGDASKLISATNAATAANDNLANSAKKAGNAIKEAGEKGAEGLGKVEKEARSASEILNTVVESLGGQSSKIAAGFAEAIPVLGEIGLELGVVGVAAVALGGAFIEAAKQVGELNKQSKVAGVGVEAFQKWQAAASQNEVSINSLTEGFKELNIRGNEFATTGTGAAEKAFKTLGYTSAQVAEQLKDPSKFLLDIITNIKKLDSAAQTNALKDIFGKSAAEDFSGFVEQATDKLKESVDLAPIIKQEDVERISEIDKHFQGIVAASATLAKQSLASLLVGADNIYQSFQSPANKSDKALGEDQAEIDTRRLEVENELLEIKEKGSDLSRNDIKRQNDLIIEQRKLNEESKATALEINVRNPNKVEYDGPAAFDSGRFDNAGDADQKAAQKELEDSIKSNKAAFDSNTKSLEELAKKGETTEEIRIAADKNIKEMGQRAIDAAKALGDLAGATKAQADMDKALAANAATGIRGDSFQNATRDLLEQREGFTPNATWDVNHYRLGYGSDTKTDANGNSSTVEKGDSVSMAGALRDLDRQIGLLGTNVKGTIGDANFDKYNSQQQAVLASLAYNYGTLPERVASVIKNGGSDKDVADAIKGLRTDNNGVNAGRRDQESAIFSGNTGYTEQAKADEAAQKKAEEAQKRAAEEETRKAAETAKHNQNEAEAIVNSTDLLAKKNDEIAKANALLESGNLTQAQFNTAVATYNQEYDEAIKRQAAEKAKQAEADQKWLKDLGTLTKNWTDSLIDGLIDGNFTWANFAQTIEKDLLKLAANKALESVKTSVGATAGSSSGLGASLGAKASGGVGSGLTMVGENGPELVNLGSGSMVYNTPDTRSITNGNGSVAQPNIVLNTTVTVPSATTAADARKNADAIDKQLTYKIQQELSKYNAPGRLKG